ncbi:hypothetical protein [Aeromonas molluscorum]|uniref:Uncharacterized protein n=1 Tax=Aeromonas molluscorum 848 TaxID=1268236 RepID=R1GTS8_9GAMM|nr:hypothetical protein [Aeromonas molluscorum]EOD55030.1 hypothetical protein G113_11214 [Aeromonas molluscorum 848]
MGKKETSKGEVVAHIVRSESVISLGKEYAELGIDAALESGALKEIPFVSTVVSMCNSISMVKDHIFATKLIKFIDQLSDIPLHDRMIMIDKLNEDDKFAGKVGTALIEILDRMESEAKPELAAKCFSAYAKEIINYSQLRHMLHALERIPTFEINGIALFSQSTTRESLNMEESTLLAYVNAGLGVNNGGLDGGVIIPTELCRLFISSGIIPARRFE